MSALGSPLHEGGSLALGHVGLKEQAVGTWNPSLTGSLCPWSSRDGFRAHTVWVEREPGYTRPLWFGISHVSRPRPAPKTPFALLLPGADPAKVSQLEGGRWLGLWGGWAWVPVPPLPLPGCVTGGPSLRLSELPFPLPKQ